MSDVNSRLALPATPTPATTSAGADPRNAPPDAPRRFLVCDDHPIVAEAIADCLELAMPGSLISRVSTLQAALAALRAHPAFDLVVLDLGLPDAQGLSAVREAREADPMSPVVVVSGSDEPSLILAAIEAGAMGFVPKSADRRTLVSALTTVAGGALYLPPDLPGAPSAAPVDGARGLGLTPRQTDVLRLILRGLPNKLICRELALSENTVKIHVSNVLQALGARSRTEAVVIAARLGVSVR
ncbi:MAG: response regulator transcription factor [Betaproteobacteria bacterium]|nr:response regulator transcription factor [Betaproteobacteria bacterium]